LRSCASASAPDCTDLADEARARILILALGSIEGDVTHEAIIDALEGLGPFDLGLGVALQLSQQRHQASNGVWPTVIRGHRVVPFAWQELRGLMHEATPR